MKGLRARPVLVVLAALLAAAIPAVPCAAQDQEVTSEQVRGAIDKGIAYLKAQQQDKGNWSGSPNFGGFVVANNYVDQGTTCLAVLALINAGVPLNDDAVKRGLAAVDKIPNDWTYVTSLKCQAYAAATAAGGTGYSKRLDEAAKSLIGGQTVTGMWTYNNKMRGAGRGDNSNTQFALLGLHEAAKCGVKVPEGVWKASRTHFERTQLDDGGWTYIFMEGRWAGHISATGTMTAAGIASLYICGEKLVVPGDKVFHAGVYPSCGKYAQYKPIADGLKWLAKNFSGNVMSGWDMYYKYALERVGMISGVRNFGPHDWYREGAAELVASQRNGSWTGPLYNTAFAILFLAKGNRPVLIQKLQWDAPSTGSGPADWNRNRYDLENLTAFISDVPKGGEGPAGKPKLGKKVTWQTVTLALSLQQLRQSPVLYLTGHTFPAFTKEEKALLRQYVESGGTLLADACCGSDTFRREFRAFAKEVFADYELRRLDASHPVFTSYYRLPERYGLEGIDVGCRTGVFFCPNALGALWELKNATDDTNPAVSSDFALKLGLNVCAYATGKEMLADRLDVVEVPAAVQHAAEVREIPRGAVRIARLAHSGDYNADVHALVNLSAMLRDKANIDVVSQSRELKVTDPKLYDYPVVFMTGHDKFTMSDEEIKALRTYLDRGGILVADACCGRASFDAAFRDLMKRVFPEPDVGGLAPLANGHAIYTGKTGVTLGEVKYRQALAKELGAAGTNRPIIEAVTVKGRTCVLYSKYDFSCGLEGDNPFSCRGYVEDDARRLGMSLFLYAISY